MVCITPDKIGTGFFKARSFTVVRIRPAQRVFGSEMLHGRESDFMVRFNVDSLLRGDLLTRMNAHAAAVQNGIKTPNEVRHSEELEPLPSGDELLIQGATVPIGTQVGLTEGGVD